jgi:hypothetical protein
MKFKQGGLLLRLKYLISFTFHILQNLADIVLQIHNTNCEL